MEESEDHYITIKIKLWAPKKIFSNIDSEIAKKQMSLLSAHTQFASADITHMIPENILALYTGLLGIPPHEARQALAQRSKVEIDFE